VANIYLEKIAGLAQAGHLAMDGAKAVGRVAAKGVKAVGNQAYLATGGSYIDHAHKLGVRDPYKLADFGDKQKRVHKLWSQTKKNMGPGASRAQVKAGFKEFKQKTVPNLQRKQTDARITVGAISAAGAYGASKVKEKLDEPKVQTYNY
jgi:hypothetical protein